MIAERIAAWQEIARRLAHEIKNPLTPIQMAMDTLRKSWKKQHPSFDEILEESTRTVLEEADRLKHIVAEFSRLRAHAEARARARRPQRDRALGALALSGRGAGRARSSPTICPSSTPTRASSTQVLLNLVENARDAIGTRDGRPASRRRRRRGDANDRALLVVEDNGPGVPLELKDKVFAPYFTTKHAQGRHRPRPRDRASHRLGPRRPHHDHRRAGRRRAVHDRAAAAQRDRAARVAYLNVHLSSVTEMYRRVRKSRLVLNGGDRVIVEEDGPGGSHASTAKDHRADRLDEERAAIRNTRHRRARVRRDESRGARLRADRRWRGLAGIFTSRDFLNRVAAIAAIRRRSRSATS